MSNEPITILDASCVNRFVRECNAVDFLENMMKCAFLLSMVCLIGLTASANAGPISLQNPYRSYNLSGINYGSQQWERDHARVQGSNAVPAAQPQRMIVRRHRRR